MNELIKFFINAGKLRNKKRKGWLVHGIKNSESTASHSFRMAILAWILGERQGLNTEKIIKMALIHDLCGVYAKDETPYNSFLPSEIDLPKNQKKIDNILKKWPTFSLEDKKNKRRQEVQREHRAFLKLIEGLPKKVKTELENLWIEFEKNLSFEARFVKQADKLENFLQGMEYSKEQGKIQKNLWLRWSKEIFDIPVLVKFTNAIEKKFFKKDILGKVRKKQEMDRALDFLIEVGKLKRIPRKGLVLIGMANPRTIADHIFQTTIMGWVLAIAKKTNFDIQRVIKIALVHDLCEVYVGDMTPYDKILPKNKEEWPELFDKWPRFPASKKLEDSQRKYEREKFCLQKLIAGLSQEVRKEILDCWLEYTNKTSKEGRFVKQINRLETLLQALEFAQETKKPPFKSWWIGSKERIDDSFLVDFMDSLGVEFSEVL